MANDLGDTFGSAIGTIARELAENVSGDDDGHRNGNLTQLSGMRGVAAGAVLAAAPMVGIAARRIVTKKLADGAKGALERKADQVGGAPEIAKEAGKKMLSNVPGMGGKDGGSEKAEKGAPGVGGGRRMPVQQAVDVGVPLAVAYNQWTQFEDWPQFMHRVDRVTQEDDCTVSFRVKVWGMSKEFVAQIVEQRPDERIQWTVTEGVSHTGVVTFHELAPNLTRVQVSLDVEPGSWIEKAARGMRHVKRAVRADLARFKAFIELQEEESGAWRGTIRDGKVAKRRDSKARKPKARSRGSSHGSSKSSSSGSSSKRKASRR
jgi:uncharacterized membrane protein